MGDKSGVEFGDFSKPLKVSSLVLLDKGHGRSGKISKDANSRPSFIYGGLEVGSDDSVHHILGVIERVCAPAAPSSTHSSVSLNKCEPMIDHESHQSFFFCLPGSTQRLVTTSTLRSFVSYLNSSSDLKGGTIVEYARKMMGLARDKHGEKLDFESFLTIVDNGDKSDENRNWFKGALHQVMVEKFEDAVANGETSSTQASPF